MGNGAISLYRVIEKIEIYIKKAIFVSIELHNFLKVAKNFYLPNAALW